MTAKPSNRPGSDTSARTRIVSGARRYFLARGFSRVTMDDLARELGMSKKTFYKEFLSKTALLEAVIRDKLGQANRELAEIVPHARHDFAATLANMLACVQTHASEIQPVFLRDIRRDAPESFALIDSLRREMIQRHFGQLFNEGRKQNLVRKDIAPPLLVEILLGTIQAIANPAKLAQLRLTPRRALSAISAVVLEGVLVRGRIHD